MNSHDLLTLLDIIAAEGNRAEKEALVDKIVADPFGKKVLDFAYNSFITFGLTPAKPAPGTPDVIFDSSSATVWETLAMLADRTLSGGDAKTAVAALYSEFGPKSAELIWRILSKDLRCGITAKTVNRVLPGTIPSFDVMLAHKFEEKHIKAWPVAVEPKLDGVRVICLVKEGEARFFSRTGKPFPAVEHLGPAIAEMVTRALANAIEQSKMPPGVIDLAKSASCRNYDSVARLLGWDTPKIALDGEIVSGNFNKTVGDVRRKSEAALDAEYHVFDALPYDEFTTDGLNEIKMTYKQRRGLVRYLVAYSTVEDPIVMIGQKMAANADEVQALYAEYRAAGKEGAIVKPMDGTYTKKRSRAWLKLKNEETEDLIVTGAFEGEGKYTGMLGGLICDRAGVAVRVGGGFSDAQRVEFWKEYQEDSLRRKPMDFELLRRMIEVEFHEVTPDGSLRHPRFVRFRDDKHDPVKVAA